MAGGGLRQIVETTYRLSEPRTRWLEGMSRAAEDALGEGLGTAAILVDASDSHNARVIEYVSTRKLAGLDRLVERAFASFDPSYVEDSRRVLGSNANRGEGAQQPGLRIWLDAFGAGDLLAVIGLDAGGIGAMFAVNLAERVRVDERQSASLAQLAAHLLSAYHLREKAPEENQAVFRTDGSPVNVSDDIDTTETLADLTRAVRALDTLQKSRSDGAPELAQYTSRVDATWSVVAEVGQGDEQWVVAKRNPPNVLPLPETLSQRERQVMTLLLLGRSQKIVAYELGIAHSTVRVLVSRALGKLDARTVEEVRARFVIRS